MPSSTRSSTGSGSSDAGLLPPIGVQRIAAGLLGASAPLVVVTFLDVPPAAILGAGYFTLLAIALWRVRPVAGREGEFRLWCYPFLAQGVLNAFLLPAAAAGIPPRTGDVFAGVTAFLTMFSFLPALILWAAGRRGLMIVLVTTAYPGALLLLGFLLVFAVGG